MNKYTDCREAYIEASRNLCLCLFLEDRANFCDNQEGFDRAKEDFAKGMSLALQDLDDVLHKSCPPDLTTVKTSPRTLLTPIGDIRYTRRIYQGPAGEYLSLVDTKLGIQKSQKIVPALQALITRLATKLSYEDTAKTLVDLGASHLSRPAVRERLENTEELMEAAEQKEMDDLFVQGVVPEGAHEATDVFVEVDSTYLASQEQGLRSVCVKGAAIYGGKVYRNNKKQRVDPVFVFRGGSIDDFKKRVALAVFKQFKRGSIKRIHIGFDGETRYQSGWHEVFGEGIKIVRYIDPYHLNKYITRAFSKQTKASKSWKEHIFFLLNHGMADKASEALSALCTLPTNELERHTSPKALSELKSYIESNREWIVDLSQRASMGTIESDHMRLVKRRMAAFPCAWSKNGAHTLVHINSALCSNKAIPLCKIKDYGIQIEALENAGAGAEKKPVFKITVKNNALKWTHPSEYVYSMQGSVVGSLIKMPYVAQTCGRHNVGYY